jgi:hypothetical protein
MQLRTCSDAIKSYNLLGIPDTSLRGLNTLAARKAFKLPALIPTFNSGKLRNLREKEIKHINNHQTNS